MLHQSSYPYTTYYVFLLIYLLFLTAFSPWHKLPEIKDFILDFVFFNVVSPTLRTLPATQWTFSVICWIKKEISEPLTRRNTRKYHVLCPVHPIFEKVSGWEWLAVPVLHSLPVCAVFVTFLKRDFVTHNGTVSLFLPTFILNSHFADKLFV